MKPQARIRAALLMMSLLLASALMTQGALRFYTNVVMIEYYENIPGTAISALTGSPKFPNSPDRVVFAPIPEVPVDAADLYGARITGVLIPNTTDTYYLIMNSDDQGQLFLSSNTNAANKVLIAREPEWNGSRLWTSTARRPDTAKIDPAQPAPNVSVPQQFTAGQARYFELLMKEGTGGDNLAMTTNPEFSPAPAPPDGTPPDFTNFGLGVWADDTPRVLSGPRLKNGSAVAGQPTTFTAGYYLPPGTASYQWFRNGIAIAGATSAEYTFAPAAGDAGANYRVQATVDGRSGQSADVALRFDAFSPGIAKMEIFNGIGGTAVDALINAQKFQENTPDEVRFLAGASTPVDIADNYGVRLSFRYTPGQIGSYRFFTRSDDASRIYLSTDGTITNLTAATQLAEETDCCDAFEEPPAPVASEPQAIADPRDSFLIFGLMKEGGGGDFFQIAAREEADTTPAAGLRPISGSVMGVMANATGVNLQLTKSPTNTTIIEERTVIFEAQGTATPAGTPVVYQWQRNGVDIPGATGARLILTNVPVSANSTMYRAIIRTVGGLQTTSTVAQLTVLVDTFPPQPRLAALRTAAGNFEVSVTFDEQVQDAGAANQANYAVSPGTISSFSYVSNSQAAVLGLSGVQAGQTVSVSVRNVSDLKTNTLTTAVTNSVALTNLLSWTGIGGDQFNGERMTTTFSDGAVALSSKDFDLISGGHQYWDNYDEATFVYEQITGDFDRAVRVEFQDTTSQWARAGLQVREALDSGVTREEVTAGYLFSQNFTIRVNPTATCNASAPGNNAYEIIHRPVEGGRYDPNTFPAGFPAIQNGFGGIPNYPTAWMRVKRIGQTIETYKSDDGVTWVGPASITYTNMEATPENESLTNTVFVGMFYAPEMNNNTTADCTGGSRVAKFRDYGPFGGGGGGGGTVTIARSGNNVIITWPSGTLQSTSSLNGPTVNWQNVAGATGGSHQVTPGAGTMMFFRTISP